MFLHPTLAKVARTWYYADEGKEGRASVTSQHIITFRQHLRPEHVGEYVLLPVEVPPGMARLEVRYSYDHAVAPLAGAPPGNAIDLGLFDAHGADFGNAAGFRGWSGTARQEVYVEPGDATPGYLPGSLRPGVWHVALGLYRIHPSGCNYEVTVRLVEGPVSEPAPAPWPPPQVRRETRWYRGDLHCHSNHSEASGTLADLCGAAREQGLDFLAVTEHNTTSHHRLLGQFQTAEFLPIPGQEITSYRGHANVWGADRWVEFRLRRDADLSRAISMAHAAGGLFSANHPKTNGPPWEFGTFAGIDCLEVWQGPWFLSNYQSLEVWDGLLQSGQRVVGVGGSDQHQPAAQEGPSWHRVGAPTTWVYAPALEERAILGAIKAGRVFISAGPGGPRLELWAQAGDQTAMMGDQLPVAGRGRVRLEARVQGAAGQVLRLVGPKGILAESPIASDDFAFEHALTVRAPTYVRPEVAQPLDPAEADEPAALTILALGNPIYLAASS